MDSSWFTEAKFDISLLIGDAWVCFIGTIKGYIVLIQRLRVLQEIVIFLEVFIGYTFYGNVHYNWTLCTE